MQIAILAAGTLLPTLRGHHPQGWEHNHTTGGGYEKLLFTDYYFVTQFPRPENSSYILLLLATYPHLPPP